jgi:hypothetical protein
VEPDILVLQTQVAVVAQVHLMRLLELLTVELVGLVWLS